MKPLDVVMEIERKRLVKIAWLGSDRCRVCGYDANVFKLVRHHPEGRAANPSYWEVWCVYCHEAYDPWTGDRRKQVAQPSAHIRLVRLIEGAKASRAAELYELDAILRELDSSRPHRGR